MTKLEFLLAFLSNLSVPFILLGIITFGSMPISLCIYAYKNSEEWERKFSLKVFKISIPILIVSIIIGCIPSMDQLWKVRLNLVKFQIASPENLEKGIAHMDELAKDLECQYLKHCTKKEETK